MTIALVFAVLMNGGAYFFSDKIALTSSGAQPITREQAPRLYEVMERLAAKANLPMPKLYVIPQAAPNAFATGRNPSHASVAVTEGLMELMNDDELEGVIAHELSHVRNYDILTSSIAATIAGAITWIASMGRWAMIFGGIGGGTRSTTAKAAASLALSDADSRAACRDCCFSWVFRASANTRRMPRARDGRPSVRADQRPRKTRRLQQANPHGHFAIDIVALSSWHRLPHGQPSRAYSARILRSRSASLRCATCTSPGNWSRWHHCHDDSYQQVISPTFNKLVSTEVRMIPAAA